MSKVVVTESSLTDIADAIRNRKGGITDKYTPSEMAHEIETIPYGGLTFETNMASRRLTQDRIAESSFTYNNTYSTVANGTADEYPSELNILPMRPTVNSRPQRSGQEYKYTESGTVTGNGGDNCSGSIVYQINPLIYKKLLIDMASTYYSSGYNTTYLRLCTDPTLSSYYPSGAGSGALKEINLTNASLSVASIQEACEAVGIIANITDNKNLYRQIIEWDVSDLSDPFYICMSKCRITTTFYSIRAVRGGL